MKLGIIGAGSVGTGLAKHLVPKGHEVMLSYSRDLVKLQATAAALNATAGTPAEAAAFAEVLILTVPYVNVSDALNQLGSAPAGRVLWDCTNALKPDMSGLLVGTETSGGEEVAKLAPWARVVKAIPPFAEVLHSPSMLVGGQRVGVFVCGDDEESTKIVAGLVSDIGAEPVMAGPLRLARFTEPAAMLLVQLAYMQGFGARIGLGLQREL